MCFSYLEKFHWSYIVSPIAFGIFVEPWEIYVHLNCTMRKKLRAKSSLKFFILFHFHPLPFLISLELLACSSSSSSSYASPKRNKENIGREMEVFGGEIKKKKKKSKKGGKIPGVRYQQRTARVRDFTSALVIISNKYLRGTRAYISKYTPRLRSRVSLIIFFLFLHLILSFSLFPIFLHSFHLHHSLFSSSSLNHYPASIINSFFFLSSMYISPW